MDKENKNEEQSSDEPKKEETQEETPAVVEATTPETPQPVAANDSVTWEASEFIHHEKDWLWFGIFAVVTLLVMLVMYLVVRDFLSIIVIALGATALAVFANRKPRVLNYSIDASGIGIGEKKYSFDAFKGYTILIDGAVESILLTPLQKFSPPISMYFDPQDGDKIAGILNHYLPLLDHEPDIIDQLSRRIRF